MDPAKALHEELRKRKQTLGFAESCTGGMMAAKMTALPGASDYFLGSIVAYSNQMKEQLLFVSQETLKTKGAVSKEAVDEMLKGLFKQTQADFGIAVSGVAGPSGGTVQEPVGTIWAAFGERGKSAEIVTFIAHGSREEIILFTANHLIETLWRKIVRDTSLN